jgi:hypothetical protein
MLAGHKHDIKRRYLRDRDCRKVKGKIRGAVGFVKKGWGEVRYLNMQFSHLPLILMQPKRLLSTRCCNRPPLLRLPNNSNVTGNQIASRILFLYFSSQLTIERGEAGVPYCWDISCFQWWCLNTDGRLREDTGWSKILCASDDYRTKNTQKYFKQFQSLTMTT